MKKYKRDWFDWLSDIVIGLGIAGVIAMWLFINSLGEL